MRGEGPTSAFSGRQNPPTLADYADAHSLDLQRAQSLEQEVQPHVDHPLDFQAPGG